MKTLSVLAVLAAIGLVGTYGYMSTPTVSGSKVFAQEDCKDGETWNEATGKCEASQ